MVIVLSFSLSGCAFKNKADPFEGLNRGAFALNKTIDRVVLRPSARIYQAVLPKFFQTRVNNFFQNITEIPTIANDILQFNTSFGSDLSRFLLNTTWGIGGLFDVAEKAGRPRHSNDFGITLGKWGYKKSAYIVLPFFGPSTVRDGIGRAVNYSMSPLPYVKPPALAWGLFGLYAIDTRACYLKLEPAIDAAAIDEYVFFRDAYLQRRAAEIGDCLSKAPTEAELLEGPPE